MSHPEINKEQRYRRGLKISSIVCFCVAFALVLVTYSLTIPAVQKSLDDINKWFVGLEYFVASFNRWIALGIVILLFLVKTVIPIIPFSVIFVSCGMVFPTPVAVFISVIGIAVFSSIKFQWGRRRGGGGAHKIADKSQRVSRFLGFGGKGNKWMLFLLCFVPVLPLGTVSRAYGATKMSHSTFITLALIGFAPRLILWSYIGVNIFNPFTPEFVTPFIVLLVISGISLMILNSFLQDSN